MSMTATNLYMNWTGVSATPAGGTAVNILEVKSVQLQRQTEKEEWVADAGNYVQLIITKARKRRITIHTGNVAAALALAENVPHAVTATLSDAKNGAGVGSFALTLALTNAVLVTEDQEGTVNKFAMGTITFEAYAPDGITDPLTVTVA